MATPVLHINEDNKIKVTGLYDEEDGAYVNDASGSFDVLDCDGNVLSGMDDIVMNYVTSSNGNYVGYLDKTLAANLTEGTRYQIEITLTSGSKDFFRKIRMVAHYHGIN